MANVHFTRMHCFGNRWKSELRRFARQALRNRFFPLCWNFCSLGVFLSIHWIIAIHCDEMYMLPSFSWEIVNFCFDYWCSHLLLAVERLKTITYSETIVSSFIGMSGSRRHERNVLFDVSCQRCGWSWYTLIIIFFRNYIYTQLIAKFGGSSIFR